jgi:hypothetical protein
MNHGSTPQLPSFKMLQHHDQATHAPQRQARAYTAFTCTNKTVPYSCWCTTVNPAASQASLKLSRQGCLDTCIATARACSTVSSPAQPCAARFLHNIGVAFVLQALINAIHEVWPRPLRMIVTCIATTAAEDCGVSTRVGMQL